MIELEVVGDQGPSGVQVAMVIGVEEFGVEGLNGLEERVGCGVVWEWAKDVVSPELRRGWPAQEQWCFSFGGPFLSEVYALVLRADGDGCSVGGRSTLPSRITGLKSLGMTMVGGRHD